MRWKRSRRRRRCLLGVMLCYVRGVICSGRVGVGGGGDDALCGGGSGGGGGGAVLV